MKAFYLLLIAAVISVTSCRTKDGEPGPAGQSPLKKQGAISGTIAFTNAAGNDSTIAFNYQYYSSLTDNKFFYQKNTSTSYYEFEFLRRDLQDENCYVDLYGYGNGTGDVESDPSYSYMRFSVLKVIDGDLYEFISNNSITVTNVNLDPSTGRLTYNFSGNVSYGSDQGTVTGTVDVTLNRSGLTPK